MKSQADAEIDDEYFDDPIRIINVDNYDNNFIARDHQLIDAEIVDFGWVLESEGDDVNQCTRAETPPCRKPSPESVTISDISHNNKKLELYQSVTVKIVDCLKYPWFYKKNKTITHKNKDHDVFNDVSVHDDDTQDIIVDDFEGDLIFNDNNILRVDNMNSNLPDEEVKCPAIVSTDEKSDSIVPSRYKCKKLKQPQCLELEKALKQRDTSKIDFKKNQGLVGLKIIHKRSIYNKTADIAYKAKWQKQEKKRDSELCDSYVGAIHKVLGDIGTSITPIVEAEENGLDINKTLFCSKDKSESSNFQMNMDKSKPTQKSVASVKCTLKVTSPKILENIKLKEVQKKTANRTENQLLKTLPTDACAKKDTKLGSKSECLKLASNAYKYYNASSKNVIQKPMPKSKKTKACEKYRNISSKIKEVTSDIVEEHKVTETNILAPCYGQTLQNNSVLKTNLKNESSLRPIKKTINRIRDTSNDTKVNNSTDINKDSLQKYNPNDISKSHSKTECNINNKTGIEERLVQKKKDDKYPQSQLEDKKLANASTTNKQGIPTLFHMFDQNVITKPQLQENGENIKDAKRKDMLQIISIDNLNNFENYIRIMRNKGVNNKVNSNVMEPTLYKTSSATVISENTNYFNNKLSTGNIPERKDSNSNTDKNIPIISIPKPNKKTNNRVSAIIIRPPQQLQYQIGHNLTRPPVQPHSSNRFQHQRNIPPAPHHIFSNTIEPCRPRLPFTISTRPQQQGRIPPVPQQTYSDPTNSTRYHMSQQQISPLDLGIYHQPNNHIASSIRNGDPQNVVDRIHPGYNNRNPNSYWFYGYPTPPPPPPLPPPSTPPPPPPPPLPPRVPKAINPYQPPLQLADNSVIGMNNDGVIKKINITTGLLKEKHDSKDSFFKAKNISMCVPDFKPITTKMEMLNELSKPIIDDSPVKIDLKRQLSEETAEVKSIVHTTRQRPGPLSKRLRLDPSASQPISNQDKMIRKQTLANKGYSPPILPIPTYQKMFTQSNNSSILNKPTLEFTSNDQKLRKVLTKKVNILNKDRQKTVHEKTNKNKEDLKKISLQEYKKRVPKYNNQILTKEDKRAFAKNDEKQNNYNFEAQHSRMNSKYLPHTANQNVDTDLGYDSDTTIKL